MCQSKSMLLFLLNCLSPFTRYAQIKCARPWPWPCYFVLICILLYYRSFWRFGERDIPHGLRQFIAILFFNFPPLMPSPPHPPPWTFEPALDIHATKVTRSFCHQNMPIEKAYISSHLMAIVAFALSVTIHRTFVVELFLTLILTLTFGIGKL